MVNSFAPDGLLHDILVGQSTGESLDFTQSFGLLTTGLYVPFAMVLPFVITFYFMLSLLEDTGYMPRLAVLVDTGLHKLGLHGSVIVPTIIGLWLQRAGRISHSCDRDKEAAVHCCHAYGDYSSVYGTIGNDIWHSG